jgi:multicomponent Na+:H+ antiporter subunit E
VIRFVFLVVLLTLVYCATLASFHPWDIFFGALFSTVLLFIFRRFLFGESSWGLPGLPGRIVAFFPFAAATVYNIVTGTLDVTLVVLHLRPLKNPGIVAIPIAERTPTGVAVSMLATTLSPGTFLVDIDWERQVMLVHCLDASDPGVVIEEHQEFYRRWQRKVFP